METKKTRSTALPKASPTAASEPQRERRPSRLTTRETAKAAPAQASATAPMDHIRLRAYYLSLERTGCATDPLADWLRAERELTAVSS